MPLAVLILFSEATSGHLQLWDGSPSQGLRWHMRLADQAAPPALHPVPFHCQLYTTTRQTNTRATASGNGHSPFSHVLGLLLVHTSNPINSSFFFLHTPTSSPNISRATDYLILPPTISYFLLLSSQVLISTAPPTKTSNPHHSKSSFFISLT